jgi:hypothetical protein
MITTPVSSEPSESSLSTIKKRNLSVTPVHNNYHTINYKITPEEMWQCIKGSSQNWGIEGYEIARKYYDYHQV